MPNRKPKPVQTSSYAPLTASTIAAALRKRGANIAAAAQDLGISRRSLEARVANNAELSAVVDDCRSTLVDLAESQLRKAVMEGEEWAVKYALDSARASSRGWRKPSAQQAQQAAQAQPTPREDAPEGEDMAAQIRREMGLDD